MSGRDRDKFRKYASGAEKARKRKKTENFIKSQAGSLKKFLVDEGPVQGCDRDTQPAVRESSNEHFPNESVSVDSESEYSTDHVSLDPSSSQKPVDNSCNTVIEFNYDSLYWGEIDSKKRSLLVEKGPIRVTDYDFPKDNEKRHFSSCCYYRNLSNGEKQERKWLVYSKKADKVYCFCCKLFALPHDKFVNSKLVTSGFRKWKNIHCSLQLHESSSNHIRNMIKWVELELRLHRKITIDKELQEELELEKTHWQNVLTRIIAVIQFLAEHNLAFRGQHEKVFQSDNGHFLGLIQMISEFDPTMKEHLRRIKDNKTHVHYLGHKVQNELIEQIGSEVQKIILKMIRDAKYYSIILDCTPDTSHQEQMSLVIRFVSMDPEVQIEERFLQFIPVTDSTGQGLSNVLVSTLHDLELSLGDCRGQGYDNGANMKGKEQGVQKRILDINRRAFFTPCSCHNLNLVIGDMAKCIPRAQLFFGITQRLYTIFAESTKGWAILIKHVKDCTLKPLSQTRWECRVKSVKVLRYNCPELLNALYELEEVTNDPVKKSEAQSLASQIECFDFIVGICIWYDILFMVNEVSKTLQAPDTQLDVTVKLVKGLISRLRKYRESGFKSTAILTAKEIAQEIKIPAEFKHGRVSKKKKHFDEKAEHDKELLRKSPEELFKGNGWQLRILAPAFSRDFWQHDGRIRSECLLLCDWIKRCTDSVTQDNRCPSLV